MLCLLLGVVPRIVKWGSIIFLLCQRMIPASAARGSGRSRRPLLQAHVSQTCGEACRNSTVKALHDCELVLPGRRGAPKWNVVFFPVHQKSWSATRTNAPCGVRYVACHVQVVLLLLFLGPPWCRWCSNWCALGCSATVANGCVCSSHVSGWLTSVKVFAAVPLGVSCFLSCWVG